MHHGHPSGLSTLGWAAAGTQGRGLGSQKPFSLPFTQRTRLLAMGCWHTGHRQQCLGHTSHHWNHLQSTGDTGEHPLWHRRATFYVRVASPHNGPVALFSTRSVTNEVTAHQSHLGARLCFNKHK